MTPDCRSRPGGGTCTGVGLDLSVVDRACRLLGHRLWVRSKPGVGSLFCIELDIVPGRRVPVEAPAVTPPDSDVALERIVLVVENDPDVLFAMTQKLKQWGASVLPARSSEEALTYVRDMGLPPDIVLADYQLDGDDTGVEAIAAIRKETGVHVPTIVITADRSDKVQQLGVDLGFTVMTKPVQVSRLRPLIEWKIRWQSPEPLVRSGEEPQAQTKVGHDSAGASHSPRGGRYLT